MSLFRRISSAVAANSFGQVVTIGTQIVLTPLFLSHWGTERYGEWLLLSGIPAYLAIADAGIGSAAGNDMTMRAGAGDFPGAHRSFWSAMLVAGGAACLAFVMGLCVAVILTTSELFHLSVLGGSYGAKILVLLSAYVGMSFVGGVVSNGYRCCGRNATGIAVANFSRLLESLLVVLMLVLDGSAVSIAAAMCAIKMLTISAQFLGLRRICLWIFKPYMGADLAIIRQLLKPALAFLAFPAGNALLLQGPVLILGATVGGSAIAVFSSFRTLARIPVQLTNVLNSSVWPEMSRAYGARNFELLRRLHRATVASATYATFAASVLILAFGPLITKMWLGGKIGYHPWLMSGLLAASALNAIWNASAIVLAATNLHSRLGAVFLIASAASVLGYYPAAVWFNYYGIAALMVFTEIVLGSLVLAQSLLASQDSIRELGLAMLYAPAKACAAVNGRLYSVRRRRVMASGEPPKAL